VADLSIERNALSRDGTFNTFSVKKKKTIEMKIQRNNF